MIKAYPKITRALFHQALEGRGQRRQGRDTGRASAAQGVRRPRGSAHRGDVADNGREEPAALDEQSDAPVATKRKRHCACKREQGGSGGDDGSHAPVVGGADPIPTCHCSANNLETLGFRRRQWTQSSAGARRRG